MGLLPTAFWQPNEFNVCGGVDFGFMSTTLKRHVAIGYSSGRIPVVFQMQMGMIDRGAEARHIDRPRDVCSCALALMAPCSMHARPALVAVSVPARGRDPLCAADRARGAVDRGGGRRARRRRACLNQPQRPHDRAGHLAAPSLPVSSLLSSSHLASSPLIAGRLQDADEPSAAHHHACRRVPLRRYAHPAESTSAPLQAPLPAAPTRPSPDAPLPTTRLRSRCGLPQVRRSARSRRSSRS
jgi:hypothetical protein